MSEAAPHRGRVLRTVTIGGCVLGVTGDESPVGLALADGRAVVYAGIIDNPESVDRSLNDNSNGDHVAAALAGAFKRSGFESVVRDLRGSFAILSTDGHSLSGTRDQIGFTALFYRDDGHDVWVASEAKQVVAGAAIPREPNLDVVEQIFFGLSDLDSPTALEGVARIPRHHAIRFQDPGCVLRRIFDPSALVETSSVGIDEVPEAFHTLMEQAVRRVMRGPDALSLSGGIDSPAVAAYAGPAHLEMFGTPLSAMSNVFPHHPTVDESRYIRIAADYFGLPLRTQEPQAKPTDGLAQWVRLLDGPFPVVSVAESTEFYNWVKSSGFEVLLTGEFEEFVADARTDLLSHLIWRGRVGPAFRHLDAQRRSGVPGKVIGRRVVKAVAPVAMMRRYRRRGGRPVSSRPPWIVSGPAPAQYVDIPVRSRWGRGQVTFFDGPAVLLEAHDVVQARVGLRVRQPWADLDLWTFFLGLRAEVKHALPGSKGLVRAMLRGRVPDLILDRRDKTVFDDNLRSKMDRKALAGWLIEPRHKMRWIDYDLLADAVHKPALSIAEFMWMKDLAAVHAFLETW